MANPTTSVPVRPFFDAAGGGFSATCKSAIVLSTTYGPPVELVGKVVPFPYESIGGECTGYPPRVKVNAFTAGDGADCNALDFAYGSPELHWLDRGFKTGDGNLRTLACVFRYDLEHPPGASVSLLEPIITCRTRDSNGWAFGVGINSTLTGYVLKMVNPFMAQTTVGNLSIQLGHWYAVAFSVDVSGASGSYKYKIQLYDYDTQTEFTAAEVTTGTQAHVLNTTSDIVLGGANGQNTLPWKGQFARGAIADKQYWSQANFQAFYADPEATMRGTYSALGTFTAPTDAKFTSADGGAQFTAVCATGTGTGGTGSPTYHLQRYTAADAAPSTGARVLTNVLPDAGGASITFKDTTLGPGLWAWYRIECVDGSSTVYYPSTSVTPMPGTRMSGAPVGVWILGDSRIEASGRIIARIAAHALDRYVVWGCRAKAGLTSSDWSAGTEARHTFSKSGGGTPTTGTLTFTVNIDAAGAQTTAGLAPGFSAAQLQTALENLSNVDPGDVICTGGPYPADIDVRWTKKNGTVLALGTNGYNNGATHAIVTVWTGRLPNATYYLPAMAEQALQAAKDPDVEWCFTQGLGVNDSVVGLSAIDFYRNMKSTADAIVALGYKIGFVGFPVWRPPAAAQTQIATNVLIQSYFPYLALLDNGTTIRYPNPDREWRTVIHHAWATLDGNHSIYNFDEQFAQEQMWAEVVIALVRGTPVISGGTMSGGMQ